MALTKTTVLSHDIRGEYKTLNEITDTFIQDDGVQISHARARGGVTSPGSLVDDVYTATDVSGKSQDIQDLAATCWTPAIQTAHEAFLRAQ